MSISKHTMSLFTACCLVLMCFIIYRSQGAWDLFRDAPFDVKWYATGVRGDQWSSVLVWADVREKRTTAAASSSSVAPPIPAQSKFKGRVLVFALSLSLSLFRCSGLFIYLYCYVNTLFTKVLRNMLPTCFPAFCLNSSCCAHVATIVACSCSLSLCCCCAPFPAQNRFKGRVLVTQYLHIVMIVIIFIIVV